MNISAQVQNILLNNFKWETSYVIPIEVSKRRKGYGATIEHYNKNCPIPIQIHDLRTNTVFTPTYPPKKIVINEETTHLDPYCFNQTLIHELNHWYTMERYGNVQSHGLEFQLSGQLNGLDYAFNRARVHDSILKYHEGFTPYKPLPKKPKQYLGICSVCGEIDRKFLSKKNATILTNNPSIVSRCHHATLILKVT